MQKIVQEQSQEVDLHGFFDFGVNAYSTLEIELETDFEENVELLVSETAQNGCITHHPGCRTFIQNLIKTGIGRQIIKFNIPQFIPAYGCNPYCSTPPGSDGEIAPFRYVEVNRHYGKVTVRRTAWYPDWNDQAADFQCSDPQLKKVWDFCKYSIKAESVFDKYVDGERERMPYEGDAYINQLGHFCCDANYQTARNTLDYFFKNDRYTWPTEWLLLTPALIRDYVLYSGDTKSLSGWLTDLETKLLLPCMDKRSLLNQKLYPQGRSNARTADIIDYPPSETDGYEQGDVNFVPNAYLYDACRIMFELTGQIRYRDLAENIRFSIRKYLMKSGIFVDSENSSHSGLHTAMFALRFGLAEADEVDIYKQIILQKTMACSVYCAQFLLECCFMYGLSEHAVNLMRSDSSRSWINMMREGATTAIESWSEKLKPNLDWTHAWGAAPANIITRYLAGIRPTRPGFTEFTIDPQPGPLSSFSVKQMTIHGPIELEWEPQNKKLLVPPGTVANFCNHKLSAGMHDLDPLLKSC